MSAPADVRVYRAIESLRSDLSDLERMPDNAPVDATDMRRILEHILIALDGLHDDMAGVW